MLDSIISAIKHSALEVDSLLKRANFDYANVDSGGSKNSTGDLQLSVDVEANEIFKNALLGLDAVKGIASEEEENAIYKENGGGAYLVAFDPLDGSSIVDSNFSVGSIFGIYNGEFSAQNLIASGYVLYGVRLELIVAQEEVARFVYDGAHWRFSGNLMLKEQGKINAPGGTQKHWGTNHKILIESLFLEGYRLRYSGGMVPDLHNILIKGGGLFSYPATTDAPNGKLRALFEVLPFALIFERAGGGAISGKNRLLDLKIEQIHQKTPCFFGSKYEIGRVKVAHK